MSHDAPEFPPYVPNELGNLHADSHDIRVERGGSRQESRIFVACSCGAIWDTGLNTISFDFFKGLVEDHQAKVEAAQFERIETLHDVFERVPVGQTYPIASIMAADLELVERGGRVMDIIGVTMTPNGYLRLTLDAQA